MTGLLIQSDIDTEKIIQLLNDLEEASPHDESARTFLMLFRPWAIAKISSQKN